MGPTNSSLVLVKDQNQKVRFSLDVEIDLCKDGVRNGIQRSTDTDRAWFERMYLGKLYFNGFVLSAMPAMIF